MNFNIDLFIYNKIAFYLDLRTNPTLSYARSLLNLWLKMICTVLSLLSTQCVNVSQFRWALIEVLKNSEKDRYLL